MEVATWFTVFHVVQLALIGLVGLSVFLLADSFGYAGVDRCGSGLGVFLVVLQRLRRYRRDSTGLAMRTARDLPAVQQEGVWVTVKDWPGFDHAVFSLNISAPSAGLSRSARSRSRHAVRARQGPRGSRSG